MEWLSSGLTVGVLVFAIGLGAWLVIDPVARVRMRRAPVVSIRDFRDGQVGKIVGRVRYLGEPLVSPRSKRTCACYEVWQGRAPDQEGPGMELVERGQDFLVEDETGTALVCYDGAKVKLSEAPVPAPGPRPNLSAPTSSEGEATVEWARKVAASIGSALEDGILMEGDQVSVLGVGRREPARDPAAATGGYREGGMWLVLQTTKRVTLLVKGRRGKGER